jgi:putative copper export protein
MRVVYLMAVWAHILTVAVWIGAMLFEDPRSVRMTSRIVDRIGGMGWYAQAVLWTTGLFMLNYRGISPGLLFTADFISSKWGQALWAKIVLVLVLVSFQVMVGHKPSKLVYGYLLVAVAIVGISVFIVRPILF